METPPLPELLEPLINARGLLKKREEDLRAELDVTRAEIAVYDKVLKAAGLSENGSAPKEKKKYDPPSEDVQQRVLDYVSKEGEVDAMNVATALGISSSYASKTLVYLRDMEKIRLLRVEAAHPSGKGRKPVYGPWPGEAS